MKKWYEKIQDGENYELEKYFHHYRPVVLKIKSEFHLRELDLDDWLQEGFFVFYRSVMNFKDDLGVTFGLYFKQNFRRHAISLLRKEKAQKRKADLEACSLEVLGESPESRGSFEQDYSIPDYTEEVLMRERFESFPQELNFFEQKVLEFEQMGFNLSQIAMLFGCSEKKVEAAWTKIKKKFKSHLKD